MDTLRNRLAAPLLLLAVAVFACRSADDEHDTPNPALPGPAQADAPGRPVPDAGAAELTSLGALLQPLLERADWPADLWPGLRADPGVAEAEARNPFPAVSARLALFERRFGVPPREALGWDAFERLAGQLHRRMEATLPEHAGGVALDGLGRVEPPWLTARALLLELIGRSEEARALLLDETGRWLWPGYWMVEAQLTYVLAGERALQLDRSGAADAAKRWSLAAWFWATSDELADDFGYHRVGVDWVLAHGAVLLAEAGEWDAARTVLNDLEQLRPTAEGTRFARQWLADGLAEQPAESAVLLASGVETAGRRGRVYAVGDPYDATSWRVLAVIETLRDVSIPGQAHNGAELRALAPDDPRAAPLLTALRASGTLLR